MKIKNFTVIEPSILVCQIKKAIKQSMKKAISCFRFPTSMPQLKSCRVNDEDLKVMTPLGKGTNDE